MYILKPKKILESKNNLYGLDHELKVLNQFCDLVWSDKWSQCSKVLRFMPTLLLYGPPGTGKTSALQNLPLEFNDREIEYYKENLDLMVHKELGESSKAIESLFNEIKERASCGHNVILHIDDIDSLLSTRYMGNESSGVRRAVNTFITQLDELVLSDLPKMPIIAATTNMIDQLDSAVKRRFSLKLNFTPILNNEVLKTIMEPILEIMNSKLNINYLALEKIVIEKKLTPNDLILAMQNAYLNH